MKSLLCALLLFCGCLVVSEAQAGNCCGQSQAIAVRQVGHAVVLQHPQVVVQQAAPLFVNPHAVQVLAVPHHAVVQQRAIVVQQQHAVVQQAHPQRVAARRRGLFGRRGVSVNVR